MSIEREDPDPQAFRLSVANSSSRTPAGSQLVRDPTATPRLDGWTIVERLVDDLVALSRSPRHLVLGEAEPVLVALSSRLTTRVRSHRRSRKASACLPFASPPSESFTVVIVPEELISIGQISRRSGLSVKALRYYDRVGLLRPAVVDDVTGFRYYAPEQTSEARAISRLRSIDVPIDDIRRCLGADDRAAALNDVLLAHRVRLETPRTRIAGHLHDLMHLLTNGLETVMTKATSTETLLTPEEERKLGVRYFNETWDLMEKGDRTQEDDDLMLHTTHASALHWSKAEGVKPENSARSQWQVSRVNAVLRLPDACLHHAQRCLDICLANGVGDWTSRLPTRPWRGLTPSPATWRRPGR